MVDAERSARRGSGQRDQPGHSPEGGNHFGVSRKKRTFQKRLTREGIRPSWRKNFYKYIKAGSDFAMEGGAVASEDFQEPSEGTGAVVAGARVVVAASSVGMVQLEESGQIWFVQRGAFRGACDVQSEGRAIKGNGGFCLENGLHRLRRGGPGAEFRGSGGAASGVHL